MTPAERNAAAEAVIDRFMACEIDSHQFCQCLEDLGWHSAAVSQALDDLQAQQLLDSADEQ